MKKGVGLLIVVLCVFIPAVASSDNQKSAVETYLQELQAQGKERVIVIFKEDAEVDPSLVEKYNGTLIGVFSTSKALSCEIPQENIELLKQEEAVADVIPSMVIEVNSGSEERDPDELILFNRLKDEYFNRIRNERNVAIQTARQEYLARIAEIMAQKRSLLLSYANTLNQFRRAGREKTAIYRLIYTKYSRLLQEFYAELRLALQEYHAKLTEASAVYGQAASGWEEKVNEMVTLSYTGPVTVRWNNLEAGLNAKAAWDNYNLDGTGIKIAFIDTGINYTLSDLSANYLGGHDYIGGDDDPMPLLNGTEDHGTTVASLAVGKGVNKIVGTAYNAGYYAVRVGSDSAIFMDLAVLGIEWASTEPHKADIISMSFGKYDSEGPGWWQIKALLENACNNAYNNGIVLVACTGNEGYTYGGYPADFDNVISSGAHGEDQTLLNYQGLISGGGVDIVAPGARVAVIHADNSAWWRWGTSYSTCETSALIALQLQYSRQHNLDVNNGYLWESMKHSALHLTGQAYDPVYQGSGKIWASETNPPPPAPSEGAVDLMTASIWPFDFSFEYLNYVYLDPQGYPAYYIGTNMYQNITLTNLSDVEGNTPETIENLNVTTIQKYLDTGDIMPGASTEDFTSYEPITINPGSNLVLQDTYYLPWTTIPGLDKTVLSLEFKFAGNNRLMKITNNEASIWCPPAVINEGFPQE